MTRFYFLHRFILLPSFVGLFCCACQPVSTIEEAAFRGSSRPDAQEESKKIDYQPSQNGQTSQAALDPLSSISTAAESVATTSNRPTEADSDQSSSVAYQAASELATSAHTLSQSAISPDDWSLVISRWNQAANQLRLVASDNEHYQPAQQKIAEYTQNAAQTQAKIESLQAEVYIPLPSALAVPPTVSVEQSTAPSNQTKGRVRVPIERRLHGTPVVKVSFNGTKQYEMILDTGASRTLITRQMANELEVEVTSQMVAATASAAEVTFDIGEVSTIAMGSLTLENASVSIGDAVSIGLLGNDFFSGYDVIIRSREGVVELVKS